jgi:hypothetical protein
VQFKIWWGGVNNPGITIVKRDAMKNTIIRLCACAGLLGLSTSCTTTYDAYGYPQQMVDPAIAVAGILAAGAIGYAIAENNNDHYHNRYSGYGYRRGYYRGGYGYRGYRGNYCRY